MDLAGNRSEPCDLDLVFDSSFALNLLTFSGLHSESLEAATLGPLIPENQSLLSGGRLSLGIARIAADADPGE